MEFCCTISFEVLYQALSTFPWDDEVSDDENFCSFGAWVLKEELDKQFIPAVSMMMSAFLQFSPAMKGRNPNFVGATFKDVVGFTKQYLCKLEIKFGERTALVPLTEFNLGGAISAFSLSGPEEDFVFDNGVLSYKETPIVPMSTRCRGCKIPTNDRYCAECGAVNTFFLNHPDCITQRETGVMSEEKFNDYMERFGANFVFERNNTNGIKHEIINGYVVFGVPKGWISLHRLLRDRKFNAAHAALLLDFLKYLGECKNISLRKNDDNLYSYHFFLGFYFDPGVTKCRVLPSVFDIGKDDEDCVKIISSHVSRFIRTNHVDKIGKKGYEAFAEIDIMGGTMFENSRRMKPKEVPPKKKKQKKKQEEKPKEIIKPMAIAFPEEEEKEKEKEELPVTPLLEDTLSEKKREREQDMSLLDLIFTCDLNLPREQYDEYWNSFVAFNPETVGEGKEWLLTTDVPDKVLFAQQNYYFEEGIFDKFKDYIRKQNDEFDIHKYAKDFLEEK